MFIYENHLLLQGTLLAGVIDPSQAADRQTDRQRERETER